MNNEGILVKIKSCDELRTSSFQNSLLVLLLTLWVSTLLSFVSQVPLCVFLLPPTFFVASPHTPGKIVPLVIRDHSNSQGKKDQISLPPVL